jgi:hypothetical protein
MIMRRLLFACAASVAVGLVACEDVADPITGDPIDVSYAPCAGAPTNPTWFAFQDGDGDWQRVTASASGSFDFQVRSGKAGVAMVNASSGLFVVYATTDELKSYFPSCSGSVRDVSSTVTGYGTLDNVALDLGTAATFVPGSNTPPAFFTLPDAEANATDLIGIRYRSSSGGAALINLHPDAVFMRRNVTGTSTEMVDFTSATESDAAVARTVTVPNLVIGDELKVRSFVGMSTTLANVARYEAAATFTSGPATAPFYGVAGSRLVAGESQMVHVSADQNPTNDLSESRFRTFTFSDPSDQSVTLGPSLGNISVTGGSFPTASYNVQSGYDKFFDILFQQGSGASFRQVEVLATSAYLDGATSVSLTVPDVSGAGGFSQSWVLVPGVTGFWSFLATDADLTVLTSRPMAYQGAARTVSYSFSQ